jgi:hypothetical protein
MLVVRCLRGYLHCTAATFYSKLNILQMSLLMLLQLSQQRPQHTSKTPQTELQLLPTSRTSRPTASAATQTSQHLCAALSVQATFTSNCASQGTPVVAVAAEHVAHLHCCSCL